MLLNEFLKEHRKVQELEAKIAQQQRDFESTTVQQQKDLQLGFPQEEAEIHALASQLQKVEQRGSKRFESMNPDSQPIRERGVCLLF